MAPVAEKDVCAFNAFVVVSVSFRTRRKGGQHKRARPDAQVQENANAAPCGHTWPRPSTRHPTRPDVIAGLLRADGAGAWPSSVIGAGSVAVLPESGAGMIQTSKRWSLSWVRPSQPAPTTAPISFAVRHGRPRTLHKPRRFRCSIPNSNPATPIGTTDGHAAYPRGIETEPIDAIQDPADFDTGRRREAGGGTF
jgi:hypothetical protein